MIGEAAELGVVDPLRIGLGQDRVDPGGHVPERAAEGGLVRGFDRDPGPGPVGREGGAQALDLLREGAVAPPEIRRLVRAHGAGRPPRRPEAVGARARADLKT